MTKKDKTAIDILMSVWHFILKLTKIIKCQRDILSKIVNFITTKFWNQINIK